MIDDVIVNHPPRRRQLAQLGSATGVYKTLVKYLVGVPQVVFFWPLCAFPCLKHFFGCIYPVVVIVVGLVLPVLFHLRKGLYTYSVLIYDYSCDLMCCYSLFNWR